MTYENVRTWLTEIDKYASENVQKLIIGNKSDLVERRVIEYNTAKVCYIICLLIIND